MLDADFDTDSEQESEGLKDQLLHPGQYDARKESTEKHIR